MLRETTPPQNACPSPNLYFWELEGEKGVGARGLRVSKRDIHLPCREPYFLPGQHLSGWVCVGEFDMGAALGPLPGSCCPAIFFFFFFLVESQGKPKLGIQNSPVIRLKQKQTLGVVVVSISEVFYF